MKKKFTDYQRRKLRKQIKALESDCVAVHRQNISLSCSVRTARQDAFREFTEKSDLLKEAAYEIGRELGERLAAVVITPLVAALADRGLTDNHVAFIASKLSQLAGPQFQDFAMFHLEEWRCRREGPVVDFDISPLMGKAASILHGRIEAIEYNIVVKV